MRTKLTLALALGLLTVSVAPAQEIAAPADRAPVPQVQEMAPERKVETAVMKKAQQEERLQAEDATVAPAVQPGNMQWWWLVGAIVVGGIILAVIL